MNGHHTDETPRCTATAKGTGERCKRRPIPGGTVCVKHGGGSPAVRAKAQQRLAAAEAERAAASFGLPVEVNPHDALLQEVHRTAGAVQWLGVQVQALDVEVLTWGKTRETHGTQLERGVDNGVTYTAGVNALVDLWQRERKHLVEVSKACISAGIEERRVRLAEAAGQELASVVRAVLDRMLTAVLVAVLDVLDDEQLRQVLRAAFETAWAQAALVIVPEEFRALTAAGGAA